MHQYEFTTTGRTLPLNPASGMWSALLNSIASGTFIYVAITEVRQPLATHDTGVDPRDFD